MEEKVKKTNAKTNDVLKESSMTRGNGTKKRVAKKSSSNTKTASKKKDVSKTSSASKSTAKTTGKTSSKAMEQVKKRTKLSKKVNQDLVGLSKNMKDEGVFEVSDVWKEELHKDTSNTEERDVLLEKTIVIDGLEKKNIAEVVENLEEKNVLVEDQVIKRSKLKKVILVLLTLFMLGIIVVTTQYIVEKIVEIEDTKGFKETLNSDVHSKAENNYKSEDDIKDSTTSSLIDDIDYTMIKTISLSDFEKKAYNKEDMMVLISSTSCYACIVFEPIMNTSLESLDKVVYRLNVSNMDEKERRQLRNYYGFTSTPTVFVVKDGVVTADLKGDMIKQYMNSEDLATWIEKNYN